MIRDTEVALQHARSIRAKVLRRFAASSAAKGRPLGNALREHRHAKSAEVHTERYNLTAAL
jgi:hypothetical protein